MKKRARLTPFAKIVILVLVILAARYAYIHRDQITSGEFLNFSDSVQVEKDTSDIIDSLLTDSVNSTIDSNLLSGSQNDSLHLSIKKSDTVSILIEKKGDVLIIKTHNKSINILLSDSVLVSDTIFFAIPKGDNCIGRLIIK